MGAVIVVVVVVVDVIVAWDEDDGNNDDGEGKGFSEDVKDTRRVAKGWLLLLLSLLS